MGDRVGAEVAAMIEEMGGSSHVHRGGEHRAYENDGLTGRAREVGISSLARPFTLEPVFSMWYSQSTDDVGSVCRCMIR